VEGIMGLIDMQLLGPPGLPPPRLHTERVSVAVQPRNGRKTLTMISGLPEQLLGCRLDFSKILRKMRHVFRTSGTLRTDNDGGTVIQLQGDCWRVARHFLMQQGLAEDVSCHGRLGEGLAGLRDIAQLESLLATGSVGAHGGAQSPAAAGAGPRPSRLSPSGRDVGSLGTASTSVVVPTFVDSRAAAEVDVGMSWRDVEKKLWQLDQGRGRRGSEPQQQASELTGLLRIVEACPERFGPQELLAVLDQLLRAHLLAHCGAFRRMHPDSWRKVLGVVQRILNLLLAHPDVGPRCFVQSQEHKCREPCRVQARSSLCFGVLRLDEELGKALRLTAPHEATAYAAYLAGAVELLELLASSLAFFQNQEQGEANLDAEWRLSACLLDAVYHLEDRALGANGCALGADTLDSAASVHNLCRTVCKGSGDGVSRVRAVLQQVYHHAIHDRYLAAQHLLVLSGVASEAATLDVPTQVLCNRTVAQLGLCAFRLGHLAEARDCLEGLCGRRRTKELLGQSPKQQLRHGVRGSEESTFVEFIVPAHMHLAVDLVEAVHLVCVVLIDGPALAASEAQRQCLRMSSLGGCGAALAVSGLGASFLEKQLASLEKNAYNGPPEDRRECVLVASKHLRSGDWEACWALLESALLGPALTAAVAPASAISWLSTLRCKVQVASLKAYLASFSSLYSCFELSRLATMFNLDERTTRSTVNRMLLDGLLAASWDESSKLVVVHDGPGALSNMACRLADLAAMVAKNSEGRLRSRPASNPKVTANGPSRSSTICANLLTKGSVPTQCERSSGCPAERAGKSGRNSSFRKHLINLNKAVAKWLAKQGREEMTRSQILANIKASPAAEYLRAEQGPAFLEAAFAEALLSRAERPAEAAGVAAPTEGQTHQEDVAVEVH